MRQNWGRNQYAGEWPNPKAAWTMVTLFLALLSVAAICAYLSALSKNDPVVLLRSSLHKEQVLESNL